MGGVYLGEEKNGGRSDLRPKAASLCTPPPQGVFGTFPKLKLDTAHRSSLSILL